MNVLLICNYKPGVGGISGQVEILQRKLCSEGHTADIFSTKASVLQRLLILFRLFSVAKHYDVLHIHCCSGWGFLPAIVGVTVGRWRKKRIVLTFHGGGGERFFDTNSFLVSHYLLRTNANIVLSGFLAKVFDKHYLPYAIIPNIIELNDSQYRQRDTLLPHFICTRAHEPLYNIPCILKAFQKILTVIPESTLTLVGSGTEHDKLIHLSQEMGLKNVTFTGRVDNSEIYRYLDQADIMLSAPTVDNMPVSILEAMNAGLLIISTNVGGVPYMIDNEKTGYLFPDDDSDALASLMIRAVQQQPESITIIHNAHQAVDSYRWENIKNKLYHTYGFPA